jgi:hypothetical protein
MRAVHPVLALRPVFVFALVGLLLPAAFAQEYAFYNVSDSPPNSLGCHIACLASGAVVTAWEESPSGVYTRLLAGELQATIHVGAGHVPVVCTRADAFLLAYADGSVVRLRQGDGTSWGGIQTVQGGGTEVSRLDIAAAPAGAAAEAYLVWQENGTEVWFSQRVSGTWSPGQLVVDAVPLVGDAMPQVAPALSAQTIVPRVYYFDGLAQIFYRERPGSSWGSPTEVPGSVFAMDMDVTVGPSMRHHLVSLGPPPSCPCNHIHYTCELPGGGWIIPERLDVLIDHYNLPEYPSIVVDADEVPHVFWYQLMHDADLNPTTEQIFHHTREGGSWVDHSDIFDGHVGVWTRMTLDPQDRPVFVWSEVDETGHDIMLCRFVTSAAAPDPAIASGLRLNASPSPAAGRVAVTFDLTFDLAQPAPAQLEVFDTLGRRVAQWAVDPSAAGARMIGWDGRDACGRRMPAGVYQARLTSGIASAATRVVLVD